MATCPAGHDSATDDYCDVCGAPVEPAAPPAAVAVVAVVAVEEERTCPACGAVQVGRFCEDCGHDSMAPVPPGPPPSLSGGSPVGSSSGGPPVAPPGGPPVGSSSGGSRVEPPSGGRPVGAPVRWHATVEADREYFGRVVAAGGPDAAAVGFPEFCPPRRFDLVGPQVTIGRRSRSRGIFPTVDLVGPPEDPGVSHSHALLVSTGDGWSVVDLGSTNGTTVNGAEDPLRPNTPRSLAEGDRVHVGAWTTITLHRSG
ncbi:FHA domain-containing protein [Actinosynnema sp. CS-041913]|uniref:FHA domain-containing protein n=1 Tax=Actinosynnema sp. CS-041913 TaxID=3239917 RepID=UPI003D90C857